VKILKRPKGVQMKLRNFFILCFSLVVLTSCATHKAARQPNLSYDLRAQENKVDNKGVILMAKCFHLKSEMVTYFDDDLLQYGLLPVQINLKNNSYPRTLVLNADRINLIDPTGVRISIMSYDQVIDKAKKSYWRTAGWAVAFGLLGAIPSLINVSNTNEKIQADYESRMLKCGNLNCGSETEGLTFFSVPEDLNSLNGWKISVILKDIETENDIILDYGLYGTIVPPKERKSKVEDNDHYSEKQKEEKSEVENQRLIEEQEKNKLAYIPQTTSQMQKASGFKLAILPWKLVNNRTYTDSETTIKAETEYALKKAIKTDKIFIPEFSNYDLKKVKTKKISDEILNKTTLDNLWIRKNTSSSFTPNVDLICNIGEKLHVDAILTYYIYVGSYSEPIDVDAFLINVNTKKIYHERSSGISAPYNVTLEFQMATNKVYNAYEKDISP
jgi:hypothetical protein